MCNESYDDYIRSILGYPNYMSNNMDSNCIQPYRQTNYSYNSNSDRKIEECYPEIYKIIYPMVVQVCRNNTRLITNDVIEDMTNEIYSAIEVDQINEIGVSINLTNEVSTNQNRSQNVKSSNKVTDNTKKEKDAENRSEDRVSRNNSLRDLIKVLIIRELLNRPNNPPRPRPPVRPPFPGGTGMPGPGRPPMMPRNMYDIYEN